nr:AMP-binding protein [uncultured Dyadobacter sp.]
MSDRFNAADLFAEAARRHQEKPALIYRNRKITFGDFEKAVNATAAGLLEKGIRKGDRVLVFVPMSDDLYRVVLALLRIGAVAVFLDEWVSISRLNACCRLAECRAFIGTSKGLLLAWLVPGLRQISLRLGLKYDPSKTPGTLPETNRDDIALITFTTGSTGTPKAAIRTHGLLFEQFKALTPLIRPEPADICMPVLPIVLLINLGAGVTSVIADFNARKPLSMKPEKVIDQIEQYEVNALIASPFFFRQLSGYLMHKGLVLNGVRKVFTGGAPVFPAEAERFRHAFPVADIRIVYGSTEAEPISSVTAEALTAGKATSMSRGLEVGQVEPSATVKIIGISEENRVFSSIEALEAAGLPRGAIGEIIVSGNHVLRDYLHNSEALLRNKIFIGEQCWHRTGDSGYLDARGHLFLTGRCDSLVRLHDQILPTFLFENHFQTLDGVETGTILLWNGKIIAVAELKGSADRDQAKAAIGAAHEAIEEVILLKKMPRDPRHHSKVDYEKLKTMLTMKQLLIG